MYADLVVYVHGGMVKDALRAACCGFLVGCGGMYRVRSRVQNEVEMEIVRSSPP